MAEVAAIALDIGRKRIGVAGCDRLGLLASPIATIERRSFEQDVVALQAIAQERQATVLVAGLPLTMDGEDSAQTRHARKWAKRYATAIGLPFVLVDERLSSVEAEELLRSRGLQPSRDKGSIDRYAAAAILQRWLDEQRI